MVSSNKQMQFEFIEIRRKLADNASLSRAYQDLTLEYSGNELLIFDRLTHYCQRYLDKSFNRRAGEQYKILNALVESCSPLGLTDISEYTFTPAYRDNRSSVATNLRHMHDKGILINSNGKYFFASEPLFKWMVFRSGNFDRVLDSNHSLRNSLTPVSDFIKRKHCAEV